MDFTPVLSAFQGAIISADNVHQFARLSAKGGNEDEIDYVVTTLSRFLEESLYISDGKIQNTTEVRKFAIYIILNGDLPELQELIEVEAISTLIWTTPTIPKCLMCEIMWNLHMEQFISEIISYAYPQLALEVGTAFLDNFKYFDPLDCLNQLKLLSASCYLFLCRLYLFNIGTPDLARISKEAFNNFQQCLKYYTTPPNNYKLNSLNKADLYKYQGRSLHSLFELMEECLINFTKKLDLNTPGDGFYKMTYTEESFKDEAPECNVCNSSNNVLIECLNNANVAMLDTCKVLVMDVSVDVFCCWSEFEEDGKSMQQDVGEICYRVYNKLMNISRLAEHPVVTMFEQIARKPVEMKDKVNAIDVDVIESNVNKNDDESSEWIKALVYRDKICHNLQLLNIVASNLNLYNNEERHKLFSTFKTHAASETENRVNRDFVETLSVKVFQNCDTTTKYSILEEHFSNKILTDMKETAEFNSDMTTIFNRLISSSETDHTDVLKLFLQSPQKVYTKIFALACENTQQTEIMLKVMRLFERFANHYYNADTEPCIIRVSQNRIESKFETLVKESNFVKFVTGLKNANILCGNKLFLLIVMTNVHKIILSKEILELRVQMKLLREAYKVEELVQYRAALLAMLAQVLDVVRWNMSTFSVSAAVILDMTLDVLTSLITTYNGVVPEEENKWLKSRLVTLQPLNMYYYKILWNPPGSNYFEVVSGLTIQRNIDLDELSEWMAQVLCICTRLEWCALYDCLAVFGDDTVLKIFHDAVATLSIKERSMRNDNSTSCMVYVHRLFIYIIRYKFFKEPLTEDQVRSAISRVASLTEIVTIENTEQFLTILGPFLAFLVEKKNNYSINLVDCLYEYFGHTLVWSTINEMFTTENW